MNFTKTLLSWYDLEQRDLPWRKTSDPYQIWVSEIIMQQTRIEQGLAYYIRFLERFPGIKELAAADERDVLRLWQGLGYYSRARNLYHSAKTIVSDHLGIFPSEYEEILKLKGIGEYTAAAISSIAFGRSYPAIDGNVMRFISRCFGIHEPIDSPSGKNAVLHIASLNITPSDPGKFNQAMMEFGALVCKPKNPACRDCPFRKSCIAYANETVSILPVKSRNPVQRKRFFNYLVILIPDRSKGMVVFLRKRIENDIWKNLYDFPLIETNRPVSLSGLTLTPEWIALFGSKKVKIIRRSPVYRHQLTHQLIHVRFLIIHREKKTGDDFIPVPMAELDKFPVPRLIERFITEMKTRLIEV